MPHAIYPRRGICVEVSEAFSKPFKRHETPFRGMLEAGSEHMTRTAGPKWTYMLRLLRCNPDRLRMDRLAEYLREFAEVLGLENAPVFKAIIKKSVGIATVVPIERQRSTHLRLLDARNKPESRAARHMQRIEALMGEDAIGQAELQDHTGKVIHLFKAGKPVEMAEAEVWQHGTVDGVVTGMVGADDTMHLYLRDVFDRDLRLIVRNEILARSLLRNFRAGCVRVSAHGTWVRTDHGWVPGINRCTVDSFETLDDASPADIFAALAQSEGNGWKEVDNAQALWEEIRGI